MFKPRHRALSLIALCLSLTGASLSLTALPAAAETAQSPALAKRLTLARSLLKLDGSSDSVTQAMAKIGPLLEKALMGEPSIAALPTDEKAKLVELMSSELNAAIPQLLEKYAVYYADNLSEAELGDLVSEYQKSGMQKFSKLKLSATTSMDQDFGAIGQQAAMTAMQKFAEWKKAKKG